MVCLTISSSSFITCLYGISWWNLVHPTTEYSSYSLHFRNPKFWYRAPKNPPIFPILIPISPAYIIQSNFFHIHFNTSLPFTARYYMPHPSFRLFLPKFLRVPHPQPIPILLIIFGNQQKSWNFLQPHVSTSFCSRFCYDTGVEIVTLH